jgi:polyribonucleotide nucleotidyltransferase
MDQDRRNRKRVTAIQLDLKIPCLPMSILREAVYQSREARLEVLAKMKELLPAPRPEISPYAPRIIIIFVNPEKVGEVIGPAGKIIKRIISTTGAKIDVEESGKICIASPDMTAAEKARDMIREITRRGRARQDLYGQIVRLEEYGASSRSCRRSSGCSIFPRSPLSGSRAFATS